MTRLFQLHYARGTSILYMKPGDSQKAMSCTKKWLAAHESDFDPLLGVE